MLDWRRSILHICAVSIVVLLGLTISNLYTIERGIYRLSTGFKYMQTITSSWNSSGVTHTVETKQNTGESLQDLINRHKLAVAELQANYPPN